MEANLRIIKSIQKINENVLQTKETQNNIIDEQNKLKIEQEKVSDELNYVRIEQQELNNKQENLKKVIDEKIEKIKIDKPKDGKDGRDGIDGKDGKNGRDGRDGKDGKNGLNGKDGKNGENGIDGVGIYEVKINDKGELIITLTNGKEINCGNVKGKDGIGYAGVSVINAKIIDDRLIITLSTGRKIDAGKVKEDEEPFIEEDPIFTNSVAYNITDENITNWNNKSDFKNNYYSVILNANGTVDTYSQDINYQTIKSNLSNSKIKDILEITWVTTIFLIEATEETSGDIKFIGDIEFDGIQRRMVFTLTPNNVLTTTLITTNEIVSNKRTSVINNLSNEFYPTTNAVYNEFDRKPVLIYDKVNKLHIPGTIITGTDSDNGLLNQNQGEGTNRNITSWNITGMDLSDFKYIRVVFSRNDITSAVTGEFYIPLDGDYITNGNLNAYVSGISMPYYAVRTRLVGIGCAVSSDKTSFTVTQTISLTATTLGMVATTVNDLFVTKIEGYY